jgi:3-oxoacyl-[acyl-carrier-protein] synthase-1
MTARIQRPVYLRSGDAWSAAGRGLAAQAQACIDRDTQPALVSFDSFGKCIELPYFRIEASAPNDQRLLEVAETALDDAGLSAERRRRIGLFVGTSSGGISDHEQDYGASVAADPDAIAILHPDQSRTATWLHRQLQLNGPSYSLSTACSSAANALLYASWMVREGQLDDALVIGVETENRLSQQGFFSMLLATRELSRPFDRRRDGIVLGECVAAVVLSREASLAGPAWRILGGSTLCDTTHPTNPAPAKIAETLQLALHDAGVRAGDINAIKAHGTGTRANDLAEGLGLRAIFAQRMPPLTSVKPVLGHTLGACGVLETLAFTASLDQGWIPATANFEQPDEEIGVVPLSANARWRGGTVLCNHFGFGGNNCALVLQRELAS